MRDIYELINLSEKNSLAKNAILFYSPIHFKRRFTNKYVLFSDGQHDSIEFIRLFLTELIQENINIKTRAAYHKIDNNNKTKF